jgi:hypothetical protein
MAALARARLDADHSIYRPGRHGGILGAHLPEETPCPPTSAAAA